MTFVCFFEGKDTEGIDGTTKCATVEPDDYCPECEHHICANHGHASKPSPPPHRGHFEEKR